jgi:hypothetical protein
MATVSEIAKRLNDYVSNIDANIDRVISDNEEKLTAINRGQLMQSIGGDGKALINKRTGSPNLSKAYAKRMKKTKPDLYVNGDFQREMQLFPEYSRKSYFVTSWHELNKYLANQYENYGGIAPQNRDNAKQITSQLIAEDLRKKVFA